MTTELLTMREIKCIEEVVSQYENLTPEDIGKVAHLVGCYKRERDPAYFRVYDAAHRYGALLSERRRIADK